MCFFFFGGGGGQKNSRSLMEQMLDFVEICYQVKMGDPFTSKLNLDYFALLMAENLYRNMHSLFIP